MKLLAFFTLLIVGFLAYTTNASDQDTCRIHRPKAYDAIERFCFGNRNVRVPSAYAQNGKNDGSGKAYVKIDGSCFPAQWVPFQYCRGQFWSMCAGKTRSRNYGRNNCQRWTVKYDGDKVLGFIDAKNQKREAGPGVEKRGDLDENGKLME